MSLDGALFDLPKLLNISKDVIAYYDAAKVVSEATEYAKNIVLNCCHLFKR